MAENYKPRFLSTSTAFIHAGIPDAIRIQNSSSLLPFLHQHHQNAAVIFMKPFQFIDDKPEKYEGVDGDTHMYTFMNFLASMKLSPVYIQEKNLAWEEVRVLYKELMKWIDPEWEEYPLQHALYAKQLAGLWRMVVVTGQQQSLSSDQSLLMGLNAVKGPALFYNDEAQLPWGASNFRSFRSTFGDKTQTRWYDNIHPYGKTSYDPVRFNVLHIPDTFEEQFEMVEDWNRL